MQKKKWKDYINLLIKLGISMIISIGLGFFISFYIYKKFNSFSSIIIIGTFLGVLMGFYLIYLQLKRFF